MKLRWLAIASLAICASIGPIVAEEEAKDELVDGMPLRSALELLRKQGIKAVEDEGAYSINGAKEQKRFFVRPAGSADALFFIASRKGTETSLTLTSIFWWTDWVHESKRPKGQRKYEQVEIRRVAIKKLK
jgi:hypothetical protein